MVEEIDYEMPSVSSEELAKVPDDLSHKVEELIASGQLNRFVDAEILQAYFDLAPGNNPDEDLMRAIKQAEEASVINSLPPLESHKKSAKLAKTAIAKVIAWYMNHLGRQLQQMGLANNKVNIMLAERINLLRRSNEISLDPQLVLAAPGAAPISLEPWYDKVGQVIATSVGRIEILGVVEGNFLSALRLPLERTRIVDAYELEAEGSSNLQDIFWAQDPFAHLRSLGSSTLDVLVLSRYIEDLTSGEIVETLRQAKSKLAPGGTLLVAVRSIASKGSINPSIRGQLKGVVPISIETWLYIIESLGFCEISVHSSSPDQENAFQAYNAAGDRSVMDKSSGHGFACDSYLLSAVVTRDD